MQPFKIDTGGNGKHSQCTNDGLNDTHNSHIPYRIAEKFGKLTLRAFGERKFGELIDQSIGYYR